MDEEIIEVLTKKTSSGKVVWVQTSTDNTLYSQIYATSPFSHICFLETGSFFIDYRPVYPVKDSSYELSWYSTKKDGLSKKEREFSSRICTGKNYEFANGHNSPDSIKKLYEIVYKMSEAFKRSKITGVVPDLSKAREALGLAK